MNTKNTHDGFEIIKTPEEFEKMSSSKISILLRDKELWIVTNKKNQRLIIRKPI